MKKPIIILAIVTLMAGVILTGYMSSAQKHKAARASVLYTTQDSNGDLKDPKAAGQESVNAREWITFQK